MNTGRQRYQAGSARQVPGSQGFAWEFRYYSTRPDGVRKLRVQTFNSIKHQTDREAWMAAHGQLVVLNADTLGGRANVAFRQIINRGVTSPAPRLRLSGIDTPIRELPDGTFSSDAEAVRH